MTGGVNRCFGLCGEGPVGLGRQSVSLSIMTGKKKERKKKEKGTTCSRSCVSFVLGGGWRLGEGKVKFGVSRLEEAVRDNVIVTISLRR